MAVPKRIHEAKGSWTGKSQLHLSYLPPDQRVAESASELRVDTDRQESFATITYTWEHEGKGQDGMMLVCMDEESKAVQIGWVDSFHQNAAVLHLLGTEAETGSVKTEGTFPAGEETWGWTIALEGTGDELALTMDVLPAGEEAEWAVRATYQRG